MRVLTILTTGITAMGLMLFGQDTKTAGGASAAMSSMDKKFVMEAADGGMAEVQLGKLAASKATDQKVKDFGQRMVDDHTKANTELMSIAGTKGITPPADVSAKHKAMMNKLSGMSGAAFDKAYVAEMVKDHRKDVADFQKEANNGKDSDVKAFASKTLPTLQEHLKMIEDISSGMKSGKMMSENTQK